MKIEMTVRIEVNANGLPILAPTPGCRLTASQHGRSFTITGNRQGLLLLARGLIGLSEMPDREENRGYHIHLDDIYEINDDGIELLLALDTGEKQQ